MTLERDRDHAVDITLQYTPYTAKCKLARKECRHLQWGPKSHTNGSAHPVPNVMPHANEQVNKRCKYMVLPFCHMHVNDSARHTFSGCQIALTEPSPGFRLNNCRAASLGTPGLPSQLIESFRLNHDVLRAPDRVQLLRPAPRRGPPPACQQAAACALAVPGNAGIASCWCAAASMQ